MLLHLRKYFFYHKKSFWQFNTRHEPKTFQCISHSFYKIVIRWHRWRHLSSCLGGCYINILSSNQILIQMFVMKQYVWKISWMIKTFRTDKLSVLRLFSSSEPTLSLKARFYIKNSRPTNTCWNFDSCRSPNVLHSVPHWHSKAMFQTERKTE